MTTFLLAFVAGTFVVSYAGTLAIASYLDRTMERKPMKLNIDAVADKVTNLVVIARLKLMLRSPKFTTRMQGRFLLWLYT